MARIIYLQTARVGTQNADLTTSIERTVVTLEQGKNFNSFVKHLHLQNYLKSEPPKVIRAVDTKDGKIVGDVDFAQYQEMVDKALSGAKTQEKPDYKELSEKQNSLIEDLQKRLAALEGKDTQPTDDELDQLKAEYEVLYGKKPNGRMTRETLIEKINEKSQ